MSQLVKYLKEDHSAMRDLIQDLTSTERSHAEKKVAMEQLTSLILTHQKGEEIIVYVPGKAMPEPSVRQWALKGFQQHALIDEMVSKIRVTQNHDLWEAKVKVLADLILLHFKEEEKIFFPKLKKYFSEEQMEEAAEKYLRIKQSEQSKYEREHHYRLSRDNRIDGFIF